MKLIERRQYLDKLINVLGTPDIKVITGVRRSGKSKLLEAFRAYIESENADCNSIQINFNLPDFDDLLTYRALYDYVNAHYVAGKENFVFIDEVQMCKDFEKAVNGLHASEKYDIYITGSNAFLLSSDLATLFTGRTFEIKVYPFSFREYMEYFGLKDRYDALDTYVLEVGMSGSYLYKDQEAKYDYIADVFDTLIVRDIRKKYKIRNTQLMDRIVDFLMDNVSNLSSARNITNTLGSMQEKIHHTTVGNYMQYLCNAFAFYKVRRYDIKGKKYLSSNDKYYLSDHTFRYAKLGTKNMDYGRILENIVAVELLRRGYQVSIGKLDLLEVDFIAQKEDKRIYYQVSASVLDEKTYEREFAPLKKINDSYPKYVLTLDEFPMGEDGIEQKNIIDFLLEEN